MARENGDSDMETPLKKLMWNGMPEMDEDQADENETKGIKMLVGFLFAPRLIGFGIAYLIFRFGDDGVGATVDRLQALQPQMGYLFLSVYIFSVLVWWVNMAPAIFHKSRIMFGNSGNLLANMFIYKVMNPEGATQHPYVVMEDEGDVGAYNRSNRSLHHMTENLGSVILNIVFAGLVFPLPVMICVIVFAVGRMWHQHGYAAGGYGGHGPGFGVQALEPRLWSPGFAAFGLAMLGSDIMENFVLIAALLCFGCTLGVTPLRVE